MGCALLTKTVPLPTAARASRWQRDGGRLDEALDLGPPRARSPTWA